MALKQKYFVLLWAITISDAGRSQIRQVMEFRDGARNASWSQGGRVIFERAGKIVLAGANASGDRALASGKCGSPEWHPEGRMFAFASSGRILFKDADTGTILDSFPAGQAHDLRFSRDGIGLAWLDSAGGHIRKRGALTPLRLPDGLTLIGIDDFTVDGRELLVTAHSAASHDPRQTEIYTCAIAQPSCRAVTHKPSQRQDVARLSPSGRKILFASSETAWVPEAKIDYESDLWIQGVGEAAARRMTWFNEPANPRYDPERAHITGVSWRGDGRWVIATITEGLRQDHWRLVKIEFPEAE